MSDTKETPNTVQQAPKVWTEDEKKALAERYKKATVEVKQLIAEPSLGDRAKIYGLFKVGNGEDIDKAPKPGLLDAMGKGKMTVWRETKQKYTREEAQDEYIKTVEEFKTTYGFDEK